MHAPLAKAEASETAGEAESKLVTINQPDTPVNNSPGIENISFSIPG
jgi:hypothetical protein